MGLSQSGQKAEKEIIHTGITLIGSYRIINIIKSNEEPKGTIAKAGNNQLCDCLKKTL